MGGSSAPKPDPKMGEAAVLSAQTGREMLDYMKGQGAITNAWAAEDRARFQDVFIPLQDQMIAEAQDWNSPERKQAKMASASADVALAARLGEGQSMRKAMAMGVNPASGAFQSAMGKTRMATDLAQAGAANLAGRQVEAEADAKKANAINLGMGLGVNPATSMGLSNGAAQAGFGGAMSGYGQAGDLYAKDYNARLNAWQADQQGMMGFGQALGSVIGMLPFTSTKEAKTDKTPLRDGEALGAIRGMPVEKWTYKPGMGDGQRHVGPYAEDFTKATGHGDGKTISPIDAIGIGLGAIRDLDRKVDQLAGKKGRAMA